MLQVPVVRVTDKVNRVTQETVTNTEKELSFFATRNISPGHLHFISLLSSFSQLRPLTSF